MKNFILIAFLIWIWFYIITIVVIPTIHFAVSNFIN